MKDNNKRVFIIAVVVATLIIGIIGATFAYFSASGGSANDAITANAATLSNLGFTSSHSKIAANLVPVASESPYFSRYPGMTAGTYTLKGGDGGTSYSTNVDIIKTAFGYTTHPERCEDDFSNFECDVSSLRATTDDYGSVFASGNGMGCRVTDEGISRCNDR